MATSDLRDESGVKDRKTFTAALDELQAAMIVVPSQVVYQPKFTYIWELAIGRFPDELMRRVKRADAVREIARCFLNGAGMTIPGELARVTGLVAARSRPGQSRTRGGAVCGDARARRVSPARAARLNRAMEPKMPLALGCMRLSTEPDRDDERSVAVLHAAFDAGVTLLDTADAYCWNESETGHNERLIARALKSWRVIDRGSRLRPRAASPGRKGAGSRTGGRSISPRHASAVVGRSA